MKGRFSIINGDAVDALRSMAPASLHAIVTDPPYCSGGSTEATRRSAPSQGISSERTRDGDVQWFLGDNMTTPGLVWLLRAVAYEAARVLVPGGSIVAFCDWRMWANIAPAMESGGLRLANMIVWDKGSPGLGNGFKPTHELAIHLCNGPGSFHSLTGTNVLRVGRVRGATKEHPTQKPVDLMRAIVRVVAPRDGVVFDPFCGSGSTGVAALSEGRRFIGTERDQEYCDVAMRRCANVNEPMALELRSSEAVQQEIAE